MTDPVKLTKKDAADLQFAVRSALGMRDYFTDKERKLLDKKLGAIAVGEMRVLVLRGTSCRAEPHRRGQDVSEQRWSDHIRALERAAAMFQGAAEADYTAGDYSPGSTALSAMLLKQVIEHLRSKP